MKPKWLIDSLLAALLWTAIIAVCCGAEPTIKLVGPEKADVGTAFDVSVEGLTLDIAAPPPQLQWFVRCGKTTLRQRFEAQVQGGKWVVSPYATVTGQEAAKIAVELLVVRNGVAELAALEVQVGPFTPGPDPPIPGKLTVLLVEETSQRPSLPPAQRAVLTSSTFRKWLDSKGHKLLGVVDRDIKDAAGNVPSSLKAFLDAVGDKVPAIAVRYANGTIKAFPLPADEAATDALITKEGG